MKICSVLEEKRQTSNPKDLVRKGAIMLESLHVKNLALIKESEVYFYPGLNILSGETGAGKSIILGSIRLALGAKAGREFIRNGEEYALIELIFKSSKKEVTDKMGSWNFQ